MLLSLADGIDYSPYLKQIKGRGWLCKICSKESKYKTNMVNHVDSRHIFVDYVCPICQYVNKTYAARRMHMMSVHKLSNPQAAEMARMI